jgi:hypothetical protein
VRLTNARTRRSGRGLSCGNPVRSASDLVKAIAVQQRHSNRPRFKWDFRTQDFNGFRHEAPYWRPITIGLGSEMREYGVRVPGFPEIIPQRTKEYARVMAAAVPGGVLVFREQAPCGERQRYRGLKSGLGWAWTAWLPAADQGSAEPDRKDRASGSG